MKEKIPYVAILMSVFNGEKFLSEQLDSIMFQKNIKYYLIVRDDGSTDCSLSILKKYADKEELKECVEIIQGENIGWKKSFQYLIDYTSKKYPHIPYIAFADQDDIWLPDKISRAISCISQDATIPSLYYSNLSFYQDGVVKGVIQRTSSFTTFKNCLARNYATGCTIVFNNSLLQLLADKHPDFEIAHDYWAFMVAVLTGKVYSDNESFILYRQHDSNQIGSRDGIMDIWKRRVKHLAENKGFREKIASALIRLYGPDMHPEALEATSKLATYRNSLSSRISLLLDSGYTLGNVVNNLFFKLRIILGIL